MATTRFLTPDGKIFRITQRNRAGGDEQRTATLAPSSVTAPIVADQAGPDYNVGPVAKLTIPGFASDAGREAGFYGVITASTTGGFIGSARDTDCGGHRCRKGIYYRDARGKSAGRFHRHLSE